MCHSHFFPNVQGSLQSLPKDYPKDKTEAPARRYHAPRSDACCLLSVHVAKIRLEPRGALEISVKKAKQEWRLTADAGKK
jgi:hypothetical protein